MGVSEIFQKNLYSWINFCFLSKWLDLSRRGWQLRNIEKNMKFDFHLLRAGLTMDLVDYAQSVYNCLKSWLRTWQIVESILVQIGNFWINLYYSCSIMPWLSQICYYWVRLQLGITLNTNVYFGVKEHPPAQLMLQQRVSSYARAHLPEIMILWSLKTRLWY